MLDRTQGQAPPLIADAADALGRAGALLPEIRGRSDQAEAERTTPAESIDALRAAGLFGIATPRRFGGSGLGFGAMVEVAAAIAGACGSTGWVYGVLTGHNWMVGLFPEAAQAEVFADPRALTASVFRMGGRTVPVDGGYRMTDGEGRFCSGIDHSDWVVLGNAVQRPEGPEPRFLLVPRQDVEIVDDWFTAGMRGTGSKSIRVKDAFIPEHRTVLTADLMRGAGGAAPFPVAQPLSLIGPVLGMAQAALEAARESLGRKLASMSPEQAGEQGALFARVAKASAEIDAAAALVLAGVRRLDESTDPAALDALERSRLQRNYAFAAQQCRAAVTSLFEAGGGSGIYDSSRLQRIWRDVSSASAHTAFTWDEAGPAFGRALLGLPPSRFARR